MGITDTYYWLRVVVYNALIGHVEVVWKLRSIWPGTSEWYILPMTFRLVIGGSGRDLRKNIMSTLKR
jgi:hypothetical protein